MASLGRELVVEVPRLRAASKREPGAADGLSNARAIHLHHYIVSNNLTYLLSFDPKYFFYFH